MVNILVGPGSVRLVSKGDGYGIITRLGKGVMVVLKKFVTWGIKFLRYLLVHVLVGGLVDLLIFNRVNGIIDNLFNGEDGTEDLARNMDVREDALGREGHNGRGPV